MLKRKESAEQKALIQWTNLKGYPFNLIYAVPNGGYRNKIEAANLKAEGVKKGIPDLTLPVARKGFHGLYIELKSLSGRATKEQLEWLDLLAKEGYATFVCKGFDEAKETIEQYLS